MMLVEDVACNTLGATTEMGAGERSARVEPVKPVTTSSFNLCGIVSADAGTHTHTNISNIIDIVFMLS